MNAPWTLGSGLFSILLIIVAGAGLAIGRFPVAGFIVKAASFPLLPVVHQRNAISQPMCVFKDISVSDATMGDVFLGSLRQIWQPIGGREGRGVANIWRKHPYALTLFARTAILGDKVFHLTSFYRLYRYVGTDIYRRSFPGIDIGHDDLIVLSSFWISTYSFQAYPRPLIDFRIAVCMHYGIFSGNSCVPSYFPLSGHHEEDDRINKQSKLLYLYSRSVPLILLIVIGAILYFYGASRMESGTNSNFYYFLFCVGGIAFLGGVYLFFNFFDFFFKTDNFPC